MGGGGSCRHNSAFHMFPIDVIDFVGSEAFHNWREFTEIMNAQSNNPTCPIPYTNFVGFVRYFNISREQLQTLLDNSSLYYLRNDFGHDLDIVFGGDDALIEEFYTSAHLREHEIQQYHFISILKSILLNYVEDNHQEQFSSWVSEVNAANNWQFSPYNTEFTADIRQWSIPELIHTFDIPRSVVEQEIRWINNINRLMFTLDLDAIYTPGHMEQLMSIASFSVNLDSDTAQPLAIDPSNIDALVIVPVISPHTLSPEEEQMVILQYVRERMGIQEEERN
jgi:hypothetical protein